MDTEVIKVNERTMNELSKITIIKKFEEMGTLKQLNSLLHRYKKSRNIIANFVCEQLFEEEEVTEETLFSWTFEVIQCPSPSLKEKILAIIKDENNDFSIGYKNHL